MNLEGNQLGCGVTGHNALICMENRRVYDYPDMKTLMLIPIFLFSQIIIASAEPLRSVRHLLIDAPVISGEAIDRDTLDGKPVVIAFFASWCPPCRTEFQALNQVVERAERPVTIIAVNLFEGAIAPGSANVRLARYLETTNPQFSVIGGGAEIATALGGVDRIPNVFVFRPDGSLGHRFIHRKNAQKMSITANELLRILDDFP